jgi:hypothetical protein
MKPFVGADLLVILLLTLFLFGLFGCATTTKIVCPQLAPPPASVVGALAGLGSDPSASAWTIDLDKHYQKLERCQ